jgi:lipoprotein NlpI
MTHQDECPAMNDLTALLIAHGPAAMASALASLMIHAIQIEREQVLRGDPLAGLPCDRNWFHPWGQVTTTGPAIAKTRPVTAGSDSVLGFRTMVFDLAHPMKPIIAAWLIAATLVTAMAASAVAVERSPQELFNEAVQLFFDAKPVESARLFDQLVEAVPSAEPELWQRGLALYYADRFADGRAQFELHRTVNPNDVENPAWHFLCVAKLEGVEAARAKLLPVGEDSRVPMKEILELFSGRGNQAAVLQAAGQGEGEVRKNQLCYAHLYLGLFHEAAGNAEKAREHITQAAGPYRMDHSMGKVAVMHAKLRGWEKAAVESGKP